MFEENFLNKTPDGVGLIKGNSNYPKIKGKVSFYQTNDGVLIVANITGLPDSNNKCEDSIFAFHLHEGNSCSGNEKDPFSNAKSHYNPYNCPHPYHAGDLPPLFNVNGRAFIAVLTNRFDIEEIIGKTIIIHSSVDDFTSQPSGNSGVKIACGIITRVN